MRNKILLTLLLLCFSVPAHAAITFDSSASGGTEGGTEISYSASAPSCSDSIVVIASISENSPTFSQAVYNSVPLTSAQTQCFFSDVGCVNISYGLNPSSGSHTSTATWTDGERTRSVTLFYCGVDAVGNSSKAEAATVNVTTAEDASWVVSAIGSIAAGDFTISGDLDNERVETDGTGHSLSTGDGDKATAGVFAATWTGVSNTGVLAMELQEAAAPPASNRRFFIVQ